MLMGGSTLYPHDQGRVEDEPRPFKIDHWIIYTNVSVGRSSLLHTHPTHAHLPFFIFTRQSLLLIVQ